MSSAGHWPGRPPPGRLLQSGEVAAIGVCRIVIRRATGRRPRGSPRAHMFLHCLWGDVRTSEFLRGEFQYG